jgi:hypothetical protein
MKENYFLLEFVEMDLQDEWVEKNKQPIPQKMHNFRAGSGI